MKWSHESTSDLKKLLEQQLLWFDHSSAIIRFSQVARNKRNEKSRLLLDKVKEAEMKIARKNIKIAFVAAIQLDLFCRHSIHFPNWARVISALGKLLAITLRLEGEWCLQTGLGKQTHS